MPQDQEYIQMVMNDIEQIFDENSEKDLEKEQIQVQKELDESIALIMKKYGDEEREDELEDFL